MSQEKNHEVLARVNTLSKEELIFEVETLHKKVFCGQPSQDERELYFACQYRLFKEWSLGKDFSQHLFNPFGKKEVTVRPTVQNGVIVNKRSDEKEKESIMNLEPAFRVVDITSREVIKTATEGECYVYWARANKIMGFTAFCIEKVEGEYITRNTQETLKSLPKTLNDLKSGTTVTTTCPKNCAVVKKTSNKNYIETLLDDYFQSQKKENVESVA
jgi:hypothetical protein